jgi:ribosome-associated heat shock protein Hsp15
MTEISVSYSANLGIRLDKWLWYARFLKSRTSASKLCLTGRIRINSQRTIKAHSLIRVGDVLTFPQGTTIRVVQILELGQRRGPASEAQNLYKELTSPPTEARTGAKLPEKRGRARPTKKDRRDLERFRNPET